MACCTTLHGNAFRTLHCFSTANEALLCTSIEIVKRGSHLFLFRCLRDSPSHWRSVHTLQLSFGHRDTSFVFVLLSFALGDCELVSFKKLPDLAASGMLLLMCSMLSSPDSIFGTFQFAHDRDAKKLTRFFPTVQAKFWGSCGLPRLDAHACKSKLVLRHLQEVVVELPLQVPVCQSNGTIQLRGRPNLWLLMRYLQYLIHVFHLHVAVNLHQRLTVLTQSLTSPSVWQIHPAHPWPSATFLQNVEEAQSSPHRNCRRCLSLGFENATISRTITC